MQNSPKKIGKYLRSPFLYLEALEIAGPWGVVYEFKSRYKLWSFQKNTQAESRNSSLSDNQSYVGICRAAVDDQQVFAKFKRNIEYREILEHVSWKQGYQYLKMLNQPKILKNLMERNKQDVGDPLQYRFGNLGLLSPTQIRYAKITQDLIDIHDSLDDYTIVEIGIGNGGQALHLVELGPLKSYVLVDIPEVLNLAKKILSTNPNFHKFKFISAFDTDSVASDLVISNYAFSELDIVSQEDYFRRFLSQAKSGYLLYNYIKKEERNLSAEDLASRIPGTIIKPEAPLTFPRNVLVTW